MRICRGAFPKLAKICTTFVATKLFSVVQCHAGVDLTMFFLQFCKKVSTFLPVVAGDESWRYRVAVSHLKGPFLN